MRFLPRHQKQRFHSWNFREDKYKKRKEEKGKGERNCKTARSLPAGMVSALGTGVPGFRPGQRPARFSRGRTVGEYRGFSGCCGPCLSSAAVVRKRRGPHACERTGREPIKLHQQNRTVRGAGPHSAHGLESVDSLSVRQK